MIRRLTLSLMTVSLLAGCGMSPAAWESGSAEGSVASQGLFDRFTADERALCQAAEQGDLVTLRALIAKGTDVDAVNPDSYAFTPLLHAIKSDRPEAVRLLLQAGANVNYTRKKYRDNKTPLLMAVGYSKSGYLQNKPSTHLEVVKALLEAKPDLEAKLVDVAWTALFQAVQDGKLDIADLLLKQGANVNAQTRIGYTPIMIAAHGGMVRGVELLLPYKPNLDLRNVDGVSTLEMVRSFPASNPNPADRPLLQNREYYRFLVRQVFRKAGVPRV